MPCVSRSKQLREDIITSTQGITKEVQAWLLQPAIVMHDCIIIHVQLGQTLENLRLEVKDALTSFTSSSQGSISHHFMCLGIHSLHNYLVTA